ncbi:acyl-CoA dehydrogenase C-terminal domain-containing protein [Variovorax beijingensis]|uniref:acyl-CoA dehydrogenase C-terminal domain-containing protein n=1 Tax=Variovorax beijingensis TaxID=2496117 RepID=UPI001CB8D061|nr:acyl-CoA dehydrogenase C-terminal domain-containing protein [Variovorax beijingensis]
MAEDLASRSFDTDFMLAKITTARFYAEHILNKVPGIRDSIVDGAESVTALPVDMY